jgi:hypothetical protein
MGPWSHQRKMVRSQSGLETRLVQKQSWDRHSRVDFHHRHNRGSTPISLRHGLHNGILFPTGPRWLRNHIIHRLRRIPNIPYNHDTIPFRVASGLFYWEVLMQPPWALPQSTAGATPARTPIWRLFARCVGWLIFLVMLPVFAVLSSTLIILPGSIFQIFGVYNNCFCRTSFSSWTSSASTRLAVVEYSIFAPAPAYSGPLAYYLTWDFRRHPGSCLLLWMVVSKGLEDGSGEADR